MLNKLAIIGVGNIGAVLIEEGCRRGIARTVSAVDVKEPDVAKGKALDVAEGSPILGAESGGVEKVSPAVQASASPASARSR